AAGEPFASGGAAIHPAGSTGIQTVAANGFPGNATLPSGTVRTGGFPGSSRRRPAQPTGPHGVTPVLSGRSPCQYRITTCSTRGNPVLRAPIPRGKRTRALARSRPGGRRVFAESRPFKRYLPPVLRALHESLS